MQFAEASKNKQDDVCELLELMRRIIIEARIYKEDHAVVDAPNDIELAIEEHKRKAKQFAERQKALEPKSVEPEEDQAGEVPHYNVQKPKIKEQDDNQMSLF
jgi:hypothetical protein